MPLTTNTEAYTNELLDEIKLFYPNFAAMENVTITHSFLHGNNCSILINDNHFEYEYYGDSDDKRLIKIFNKLSMYKALSNFTGRIMPWGSLTGIRPTKLAYDMIESGAARSNIQSLLESEYMVSPEKASIIKEIIVNQSGYFPNRNENILFYLHIPFCKTICSYCAFIAEPVGRSRDIVKKYTQKLVEEINDAKNIIKEMGKKVYAVYMGGGTPTSIDDESFEQILAALNFSGIEFTCEAGRPDTITDEKMDLMKKYGINRLCVNPQTLNDATLKSIGRTHTAEDFYDCFERAKKRGMDLNVDLISGLPNENFEDFVFSLNKVATLNPENITVHTLAIKNGAELKNANYGHNGGGVISKMTAYAHAKLSELRYIPYYLYRQKYMAENLENIGYSVNGKQCAYNITSMEEALPVMACGAGGISKMLCDGGRIERLANLRDVRLYIDQADTRLVKKRAFFIPRAKMLASKDIFTGATKV